MNKTMWGIGMLTAVAGAGIVYYLMAGKDETPVGLVVRKSLSKGQVMGEDEDGNMYRYAIVEGSFRPNESAMSVSSTDGVDHLLVVFENETPIEARVIHADEWNEENHQELLEEYGIEEEEEEVEPVTADNPQVQNADNILRGNVAIASLQSNHFW